MKILHTSDWHLGGRLHLQDRAEEQQKFLDWLTERLREERPDALVVAGDLFDTYTPSLVAQKMYFSFLTGVFQDKLCQKVVIIGGNHDSVALLESPRMVLSCVDTVVQASATEDEDREIVPLRKEDGSIGMVLCAVPFLRDADLRNETGTEMKGEARDKKLRQGFTSHYARVLKKAHEMAPDAPVVLMGHCAVTGAKTSDDRSERSREIGGVAVRSLEAFGDADYVALGHLHLPQTVGGRETIRYSGSPYAMSFDEAVEEKQVVVVTCGQRGGEVQIRTIPIPCFQPLVTVAGTREEILEQIDSSVIRDSAWVRIRVTDGEGPLATFWETCLERVTTARALLLVREDARVRKELSGISTLDDESLKTRSPLEIAFARLEDESLDETERARYQTLLREVAAEVEAES